MWGLMVRIVSFMSNKDTERFKQGIIAFVDRILSGEEQEVLIVCHWFVMRVLRQELIKRGFTGKNFKTSDYGILYVFERPGKDNLNR